MLPHTADVKLSILPPQTGTVAIRGIPKLCVSRILSYVLASKTFTCTTRLLLYAMRRRKYNCGLAHLRTLSSLYLFSTLDVTHVIKSSPAFHVMGSKVTYNNYARSGSGPANEATPLLGWLLCPDLYVLFIVASYGASLA